MREVIKGSFVKCSKVYNETRFIILPFSILMFQLFLILFNIKINLFRIYGIWLITLFKKKLSVMCEVFSYTVCVSPKCIH